MAIPKSYSRTANYKCSHLAANPSLRCHSRSHPHAKLVRRPNGFMPVLHSFFRHPAAPPPLRRPSQHAARPRASAAASCSCSQGCTTSELGHTKNFSMSADSKSSYLTAHPSLRCHPQLHPHAKLVRRPNKLIPVPHCLSRRPAASASSSPAAQPA